MTYFFVASYLSFNFSIDFNVFSSSYTLASACSFFEASSPYFIPANVAYVI